MVSRFDYDPYGRKTPLSGSVGTDFGFAGYFYHAPSGLNPTLYRAYEPALGRWLSRDPIFEQGGVNLYGYVGNDPGNGVDIWGLSYCQVQKMLEIAKQINPELPIPETVDFEDLPDREPTEKQEGSETFGRTSGPIGSPRVTLDVLFLTHLSCKPGKGLGRLYFYILHETSHIMNRYDGDENHANDFALDMHKKTWDDIKKEFSECCDMP